MTRDQLDMMQAMRMVPPGITEFGGTLVATTPEETLWNEALAKAQARINNPRWLPEGVSYDGVSGNIDSPDIVARELFTPLQNAFHPEEVIQHSPRMMTDLDRSVIADRAARSAEANNRLKILAEREKRLAFENDRRSALAERQALNQFNLRSRTTVTPRTKAQDYALKAKIDLAKEAVTRAQRMQDADAVSVATANLDELLGQLGDLYDDTPSPSFSPVMPSFEISPSSVMPAPPPGFAPEPAPVTTATLPAPVVPSPTVQPRVDIDLLRQQAMEAMKRKDPVAVAKRFREMTGQDLNPVRPNVAPSVQPRTNSVAPMPPFYGPLPVTNSPLPAIETNVPPAVQSAPSGVSLRQFADNIKRDYANKLINEAQAAEALAKLEQNIKRAFVAGKMTDKIAAASLSELGFSKAEAYEFLMSEEP